MDILAETQVSFALPSFTIIPTDCFSLNWEAKMTGVDSSISVETDSTKMHVFYSFSTVEEAAKNIGNN